MARRRRFSDSDIAEVIRLMRQHGVVELTVERNGARLHLCRSEAGDIVDSEAPAPPSEQTDAGVAFIRAHMVGYFHRAPQPEGPPPLEEGQKVEMGQVVGSIETLDILSEVRAEVAGQVEEVLVEDGQAVDYGYPLFRVKVAPPTMGSTAD